MINTVLNFIAPHHCYGCQKIGDVLCANCKYNIISEPFSQCIVCLQPTSGVAVCRQHTRLFSVAWCVGERDSTLEKLIDAYKFNNNRDAVDALGRLLAVAVGHVPSSVVFVPVPTIRPHVRQRGYDHALRIARQLKKYSGGNTLPLIVRQENTVQRGATQRVRRAQSERAFALRGDTTLDPDLVYVIVDDVYTTGSTVQAIRNILKRAGAKRIGLAVATRQNLDGTA